MFFKLVQLYGSGIIEPANRGRSSSSHLYLVSEEIANVTDAVLDHCRTLQRKTPGNDSNIFGKTHRSEHFGSEHTRVSDFCPLLQIRVVSKDFHGWFGVWVEGRLETKLSDSNLLEESFDGSNQITKGQIIVGYKTFDLVELAQVSCIHSLVTEDTIDGEVSCRLETSRLVGQLVQHLRRNSSGVCSKQILESFFPLEIVAVSDRSSSTDFVHGLYSFIVFLRDTDGFSWFLDEESIVGITGRVRLWLEKRVEVPERRLDPLIGRHLSESHLH